MMTHPLSHHSSTTFLFTEKKHSGEVHHTTPHMRHPQTNEERATNDKKKKSSEMTGSSFRDYVQIIKTHARPKHNFLSSTTFTHSPWLRRDSESQQISPKVSIIDSRRKMRQKSMPHGHPSSSELRGDDACREFCTFFGNGGWMMMMIIDEAWQGGTVGHW